MEPGRLTVCIGPMFAGKTTTLLNLIGQEMAKDKRVFVIKHATDSRYVKDQVVTHTGRKIPAVRCYGLAEILEEAKSRDVIAIDEGQFFHDLVEVVKHLVDSGKDVLVSGLNSGHDRKPFSQMAELAVTAELLLSLKTKCRCGQHATFTIRHNYDNPRQFIGGEEMYRPTCRRCYLDEKMGA